MMRIITHREAAILNFKDAAGLAIYRMKALAKSFKEAGERMQKLGQAMAAVKEDSNGGD